MLRELSDDLINTGSDKKFSSCSKCQGLQSLTEDIQGSSYYTDGRAKEETRSTICAADACRRASDLGLERYAGRLRAPIGNGFRGFVAMVRISYHGDSVTHILTCDEPGEVQIMGWKQLADPFCWS